MTARRTELEARLREHPQNVEARLVYADLLQAENDPRGELIMLQHAGQEADAAALIERHADELLGPLAPYTEPLDGAEGPVFHWHLGFIDAVRIGYDSNYAADVDDHERLSLDHALSTLLAHPSGMLLETLVVPINMLDDGCYFEPVCAALARQGSPTLRQLRLGEYRHAGPRGPTTSTYDYEISWTSFGVLDGLWTALPRLQQLVLQGCLDWASVGVKPHAHGWRPGARLGVIDAPCLKQLEIITGGLAQQNTRAIAAATFPALQSLELWFGSPNYGFSGGVSDLDRLLSGEGVPRLTHLGLMNATFTDELIDPLADSALLPRLESLSLALGTLTSDGASRLRARASSFAHLRLLDLEHNHLVDRRLCESLCGLCQEVRLDDQRELDGDRFAAVGE